MFLALLSLIGLYSHESDYRLVEESQLFLRKWSPRGLDLAISLAA